MVQQDHGHRLHQAAPLVEGRPFARSGPQATAEISSAPQLLGDRFITQGRSRALEFRRAGALRSEEGELEAISYVSACGRIHVTLFND